MPHPSHPRRAPYGILVLVAALLGALALYRSVGAVGPSITPPSVGPAPSSPSSAASRPGPFGRGHVSPRFDLSHLSKSWKRPIQVQALLSQWDWREEGMVTAVRNQGSCGSCYAFAGLGTVESQLLIDGRGTYDLSENNVIECNYEETGCNGGNIWIVTNRVTAYGTVSEACDPYNPADEPCRTGCTPNLVAGEMWALAGTEAPPTDLLKDWLLNYGPLYVSMDAGEPGNPWYQEYQGYNGSYTLYYERTAGYNLNHGVLLVGWDDGLIHAGGSGGWIVKNSWGTYWGGTCGYGSERGYFTIAYGSAGIGSNASLIRALRTPATHGALLHHDEAGITNAAGWQGVLEPWGLARLTPSQDGCATGVEIWTTDTTTDVDVYIYDTFNGSVPLNLLWQRQNLAFAHAGYHSMTIDPPLPVMAGNDLNVVVKFGNATSPYALPVDDAGPVSADQSFASATGAHGTWIDLAMASTPQDIGIRLRLEGTCAPSTATVTPTQTPTATATGTPAATRTPTATATATYTALPTPTPSATSTPSATATHTPTPTGTETLAPTPTPSPSATQTPTPTTTLTPTATRTHTATPSPPARATRTPLPTATSTAVPTVTPSASPTYTVPPPATATRTATSRPTETLTAVPTPTATRTYTTTPSGTPTPRETATWTPTPIRTLTPTPLPTTALVCAGGCYASASNCAGNCGGPCTLVTGAQAIEMCGWGPVYRCCTTNTPPPPTVTYTAIPQSTATPTATATSLPTASRTATRTATRTLTPTAIPSSAVTCMGGCYSSASNCANNCGGPCTELTGQLAIDMCGWGPVYRCCTVIAQPTPSNTMSPGSTATPPMTATPTATGMPLPTASATPLPGSTATPTRAHTPTRTPTSSPTPTSGLFCAGGCYSSSINCASNCGGPCTELTGQLAIEMCGWGPAYRCCTAAVLPTPTRTATVVPGSTPTGTPTGMPLPTYSVTPTAVSPCTGGCYSSADNCARNCGAPCTLWTGIEAIAVCGWEPVYRCCP